MNFNRPNSPSTSLSLLESVRNQDKAAWQELVQLYGPLVYEWCRRRGFSSDASEVIGQEVFIAVFTSLQNFRKESPQDTFRGWLRRVTLNKCADYLEHHSRQPTGVGGSDWHAIVNTVPGADVDDSAPTSAEILFLYERAVDLIRGEFSDLNTDVFIEVVAKDRSPKDVADEFGISINVVYLVKSRIMKRLRERFVDVLPGLLGQSDGDPSESDSVGRDAVGRDTVGGDSSQNDAAAVRD